MAKLSEQQLDQGRQHLRARDIDGFMRWVESTGVHIDLKHTRRMFQEMFEFDNGAAIRVFDKTFPEFDPVQDRVQAVARLVVALLVLLGIMGGLGWLVTIIIK